jgi:hypothetical protein
MPEDRLREAYSALRALASMDWDTVNAGRQEVHFEALARVVQKLGGSGALRGVRASRLDRARRAWTSHIEARAPISRSDILTLCWDPGIAMTPRFGHALREAFPLRSRSLRGLVTSYHESWPSSSPDVDTMVGDAIKYVGRCRRPIDLWVTHAPELVGSRAPVRFAEACVEARSSVTKRMETLGLQQTSKFARQVIREMAFALAADMRTGKLTSYFLEKVFPEDNSLFEPVLWGEAFEALISTPQARNGSIDRQRFVDLALHVRKLPDPRMRVAEWQNVPAPARQQVMQWLSEEDLRFFFDLIMEGQRDPQGRYAFWIRYVGMARRARVVIGQRDHDRLLPRLEEIKSRGRSYARLRATGAADISASAFIMDFGNVLIVEFSKPNSACYIYQNGPDGPYLDLTRSGFDWHELKSTQRAARWLAHAGSWELKFQRELAAYGVRPQ